MAGTTAGKFSTTPHVIKRVRTILYYAPIGLCIQIAGREIRLYCRNHRISVTRLLGYAGDDEQQQVIRCFSDISLLRIATAIKNLYEQAN
ncbi:hypothetical protein [Salinimonas lutimaris]|uniref:hypothetical protein n=1 Tax=Salinimonas lutimaris TaxID=914153 RepID=UPI0010C123DE|nr:hypothetical protein [Salinimonas lutimaris]